MFFSQIFTIRSSIALKILELYNLSYLGTPSGVLCFQPVASFNTLTDTQKDMLEIVGWVEAFALSTELKFTHQDTCIVSSHGVPLNQANQGDVLDLAQIASDHLDWPFETSSNCKTVFHPFHGPIFVAGLLLTNVKPETISQTLSYRVFGDLTPAVV